ncbi:MAG: hypothetical protein ACR2O6_13845 [Ilumatobacteraceae bacterium]
MSLVLDAGALIALERGDRRMTTIVADARRHGERLVVPAGVLAQVWRDGRRQALIARLVRAPLCAVRSLNDADARSVGHLLGATTQVDVVDASVVIAARAVADNGRAQVVTSDPDDLARLDPTLELTIV